MRITVAGTGYVGLVTAVCLAEKGNDIICLDKELEKINKLKKRCPIIYERGLEDLMKKNKERITYTCNKEEAYGKANVIIIGVGTPENEDGSANLIYIYEVIKDILKYVIEDCLVVIKSTVPVGTNNDIQEYINNNNYKNIKIELASNPEFLSQGTAIKDTLFASRIVIGVRSNWAENILRCIYKNFTNSVIIKTDVNSSEMIKYAANNFLALKISYINEIANLCEMVDANIEDVSYGIGLDKRIGSDFLKPGIGYGGSCFPKDTKALNHIANKKNIELKTIKATIDVNKYQKQVLFKKAKELLKNFENKTVAVLGLAFKPGTDDIREAPSIPNIHMLNVEGAIIKVWDPVAVNNFKKAISNIQCCNSIDEAIKDSDVCFIFTEWPEIKKYDISNYSKLMKTPIIFDGRNCYDLSVMKNEKVYYSSIGRKKIINIELPSSNK